MEALVLPPPLLPVANNVVLPLRGEHAPETEFPSLSSLACREVLLHCVRKRSRSSAWTHLLEESPFRGRGILEGILLDCRVDKAGKVAREEDVVEVVESVYDNEGKTFTKGVLPLSSLPFRIRFALERMIRMANDKGERCSDSFPPRFCGSSLLVDLRNEEEFANAYRMRVDEESVSTFCIPSPQEVEEGCLSFDGEGDSFEEDCWVFRAEENEEFVETGVRDELEEFIDSWKSLLPSRPSPMVSSAAFARVPRAVLHVDVMN